MQAIGSALRAGQSDLSPVAPVSPASLPPAARALGRLCREVVALDEMHLDQVSRRLPILRHLKRGDMELLPGKLVALFDVRLQQWRAIDYIAQAKQNGMRRLVQCCAR